MRNIRDSLYGLKESDRYSSAYSKSSKNKSNWLDESDKSGDRDVIEDIPAHKPDTDGKGRSRKTYEASDTDEAQKKFGGAKAISSDMFFNKDEPDFETRQTMSKFEGQKSISSADFYGGGPGSSKSQRGSSSGQDMSDIKDSVKQGVHKVAGKLSGMASGVMSSIQDHYG